MSILIFENNLPPNVKGKCRGNLEIRITELRFKNKGFSSVYAKIIFWGQNFQSGAILKLESRNPPKVSSTPHVVNYNILTKFDLFKSYLLSCEPIEIKLTSVKTNLQIGTCFVPISKKILNSPEKCIEVKNSYKIFSPRNLNLGELILDLKINFIESSSSEIGYQKKLFQAERDSSELSTDRSSKMFVHKIPDLNLGSPMKSFRVLQRSDRSSVLNYLTGRKMTRNEETKALKEICEISPAGSLIEALNEIEESPRCSFDIPEEINYTKMIDSVKIFINNLSLTKAGIREMSFKKGAVFIIECKIDEALKPKTIQSKPADDEIRVSSKNVTYFENLIEFNAESVQRIKISDEKKDYFFKFYIWFREFGTKQSKLLGTAQITLNEVLKSNKFSAHKKCPVKSSNGMILMGNLIVKLELGVKGLNFGLDFIDAVNFDKENVTLTKEDLELMDSNRPGGQNTNKKSEESFIPESDRSKVSSTENYNEKLNFLQKKIEEDEENLLISSSSSNSENFSFLHGILYVGSARNLKQPENNGYFLFHRAFWNENPTSTNIWPTDNFNYLENFPVICNEDFLQKTKNKHLHIQLWEKKLDSEVEIIGYTNLPLHQFYIAYRDATMSEHLKQSKLPVISFDGLSTISVPSSGESCGQLQAILAIGTDIQIEFLKQSRGLAQTSITAVPTLINNNAETQTSFTSTDPENQSADSTGTRNQSAAEKLSAFIDNLTQRLPERNSIIETTTVGNENQTNTGNSGLLIRRTSDLLDMLQQALTQSPPPPPTTDPILHFPPIPVIPPTPLPPIEMPFNPDLFKVMIEIENALHLPKIAMKVNKKCGKRGKCKNNRGLTEVEPSAYVTFEAVGPATSMVKSHEGPVYATNVVEKNCNPTWSKRFEVALPVDLMTNNEKRFILKVWRKAATDIPQCRLLPTPFEDAVVGFSAIDISVLLTGMPTISGWYNIIDFSGRCNGQVKVIIQPMENLQRCQESVNCCISPNSSNDPSHNLMLPLSIDCSGDLSNVSLSRALKRKFTELEEITQRLRARLHDVTGDNEEVEDEFERDLNTEYVEEEEEENYETAPVRDFGWLQMNNDDDEMMPNSSAFNEINIENELEFGTENGNGTDEIIIKEKRDTSFDFDLIMEIIQNPKNNELPTNTSSSNVNTQNLREGLARLVKQFDLDKVITPDTISDMLDGDDAKEDISVETMSTSSQDRVRMISDALQKTDISGEDMILENCDQKGPKENNCKE